MRYCDLCPGDLFFEGAFGRAYMVLSVRPWHIEFLFCWTMNGGTRPESMVMCQRDTLAGITSMYNNQVWRDGVQMLKPGK